MRRVLLFLAIVTCVFFGALRAQTLAGTVTKAPAEQIDLSIDFSARASNGVTLSSVTAYNQHTKSDATSAIIAAAPAPSVSGQVVSFRVQGGNNGDLFSLRIVVQKTDTGEILEGVIALQVIQS